MSTRWNILYDRGDGTSSMYLAAHCDYQTAEKYLTAFVDRYVGKVYPNGEGMYPFSDPKIVGIRDDGSIFIA